MKAELLKLAQEAKNKTYSPYSSFGVGATLVTNSGKTFSGCNVENASYGLTLCAEASAIANMILSGERDIKEILIISDAESHCAPCGACRQRILEFATPDTLIHMANNSGNIRTTTMRECLPHAFNNHFLPTTE